MMWSLTRLGLNYHIIYWHLIEVWTEWLSTILPNLRPIGEQYAWFSGLPDFTTCYDKTFLSRWRTRTVSSTRIRTSRIGQPIGLFSPVSERSHIVIPARHSMRSMTSGPLFTNVLWPRNSIVANSIYIPTLTIMIQSGHKFAHITTAWLSWQVQHCDMIGSLLYT